MKAYTELLSKLNPQTLILTVNRRLALHLAQAYAEQQKEAVWAAPNILPLSDWIKQIGENNPTITHAYLSDLQETLIWEEILAEYAKVHPLIQVRHTAQLAKQAKDLMHHWQIKKADLLPYANEETHTFIDWLTRFEKKLAENHWASQSERWMKKPPIDPAITHLILVGFDDVSPALNTYLQHYQSQGLSVEIDKPTTKPANTVRFAFADQETELKAMAQWAKTQIEKEPHKHIACLIPQLTSLRDEIETVFTDILAEIPFNISAGKALSHYPIINAAIDLLSLNMHSIDFSDLSNAIMNIYHNETLADRCAAAALESELRFYPSHDLTVEKIQYECHRQAKKFPGATLNKRWAAYTDLKRQYQKARYLPSDWAAPFQAILFSIGWPSQRPLNSETYQVMQRWQKLWDELASLDVVCAHINYAQAVRLLKQLASQTLFQKKSRQPAQIHIMGLLESSGLYFDDIWLFGIDDETWPPKANPNPFIPHVLQRQHHMPHANSERELAYCQTVQQRLMQACQQLYISYPLQENDKKLNPSRLIYSIPLMDINRLLAEHAAEAKINSQASLTPAEKQLQQPLATETILDNQAPPLKPNEINYGGSWILKQQALCPFRAFASVRLNAKPLNEIVLGVNAAKRGTLTHTVLELIWKSLKTQKALLSLTNEEMTHLVTQKINEAVKQHPEIEKNYLPIEKKRLQKLITHWLAIEKERPDFSVLEQETDRFIQIGELRLKIKIDRIDLLDHHTLFIIDYKTGSSLTLTEWFEPTLRELQLPLYAVYGTEQAVGISYAHVYLKECQFSGIIDKGAESLSFSKIETAEKKDKKHKRPWLTLKTEWKNKLAQLSADFCRGFAEAQPSKDNCKHCDLHALCRTGVKNEN